MTKFSLISLLLYVTAASEFVSAGTGGRGVKEGRGGSLGCEAPNFLHCCSSLPAIFISAERRLLSRGHTQLICNKGRVEHSGRNLCVLLIFLLN